MVVASMDRVEAAARNVAEEEAARIAAGGEAAARNVAEEGAARIAAGGEAAPAGPARGAAGRGDARV